MRASITACGRLVRTSAIASSASSTIPSSINHAAATQALRDSPSAQRT
jgi:hypothetical protein